MKLKTFNQETLVKGTTRKPSIRIARQGQISISESAVTALRLAAGDAISIVQDEDEPTDWYVQINGEDGFPTRLSKSKGSRALYFNSSDLAKIILDALGHTEANSVGFTLVTTPTEIEFEAEEGQEPPPPITLYPILTAKPFIKS